MIFAIGRFMIISQTKSGEWVFNFFLETFEILKPKVFLSYPRI